MITMCAGMRTIFQVMINTPARPRMIEAATFREITAMIVKVKRAAAAAGIVGALLAIWPMLWLDWMKAYHLMPGEKIVAGALTAVGVVLMVTSWIVVRRVSLAAVEVALIVVVFLVYGQLKAMSARSPQKHTMADLRTIATALEARATDMNEYPQVRSVDELARLLEPTYVKNLPRTDAWRHEWRYEAWKADPADKAAQVYAIGSAGRDWKWEKPSLRMYAGGATTNFDCDIVYSNGAFICYPEGVQGQ